jgi:hypothetical protein
MAWQELLLAVVLTWQPPWYPPGKNPETPEQYKARVDVIVEAVATEARLNEDWALGPKALAAATMVIWYRETRLAHEVHAGTKSRYGQDDGKARCLGQLHVSGLVPKEEWETLTGTDLMATRRCARATMRVLTAYAGLCRAKSADAPTLARVFGAYGSGKGCTATRQSRARAQRWAKLMSRL